MQTIKKVALTVITLFLSDLQASIEMRTFDHVQSVVGSKSPDTGVVVSTVLERLDRLLPLHLQQSPSAAQSRYVLKDTRKELTQETGRATVASLSQAYLAEKEGAARFGEKSVVEKKRIHPFINYGNEADPRYTDDKRSHTEQRRGGRRISRRRRVIESPMAENLN